MIPPFEENGYLPPGIHPATLDEIEARFGRVPEIRRVQMESLRWLVDLAKRAGVERLVVNGSFTTDAFEPNDVDCALLLPANVSMTRQLEEEFEKGLPFLQIDVTRAVAFFELVDGMFATDRRMVPKGVVEVIL
jgi:hypothetical protein